ALLFGGLFGLGLGLGGLRLHLGCGLLRGRLLRLFGRRRRALALLLNLRDGLAAQPRDRAAGSLDLLARALREAVRGDRELLGQVALAEDLHVDARRAD